LLSLAGHGSGGEVLDVFVTKRRYRRAALVFLERAMKRYGRPKSIVMDRLRRHTPPYSTTTAPSA
jgi:transposase-like protein